MISSFSQRVGRWMVERSARTPGWSRKSCRQPMESSCWRSCPATTRPSHPDRWQMHHTLHCITSLHLLLSVLLPCAFRSSSSATTTTTRPTTTWFLAKRPAWGSRPETFCRLSTRTTSTGGRWSETACVRRTMLIMDFLFFKWVFCGLWTGPSCGGRQHRAHSQSDAGGEEEGVCQKRCGTATCWLVAAFLV